MMNMEYEYKYRLPASLNTEKFRSLVDVFFIKGDKLGFAGWKLGIVSVDYYFSKGASFLRYRASKGEPQELTIKKKTNKNNGEIRQEVNLITTSDYSEIVDFCQMLGYKFNFSIRKETDVWTFDQVKLSRYSTEVINKWNDHRWISPIEQFIEVEIREMGVNEDPLKILDKWEKRLRITGINKKQRVNKSIFELYRCR